MADVTARLPARPRRFARELRALPGRAKVALVLALALTVALLAGVGVAVTGGDDPPADDGGSAAMPSTTLATGDLDIAVPDGWQEVPIPALGVGLAVPPGWEAVRLDPDGLSSLAGASPQVPAFTESAHDAREQGGLFYAAGADGRDRVSDVMLAAFDTEVSDLAGLETFAGDLSDATGAADAAIEPVAGAERPTVRRDFRVGDGDETAEGTEVLVLGDNGLVWSLVVTSDDAAIHDDLVTSLLDTFTLADS